MSSNDCSGEWPVVQAVTAANIDQVIKLVLDVFVSDVAQTLSAQGAATFAASSPDEQRKGLAQGHFFLAATCDEQVIGVVRLNLAGHLYLLFVDSARQGCGIGKKLLATALQKLHERRPDLEFVTLNASLNAVDIYQHWRCKATGALIEKKGIRVLPMELRIREFLDQI